MKIIGILLLILTLISCNKMPTRDEKSAKMLQFFEKQLDAQSDVNRQFHVASAANLQVPGYIVGIEEAPKKILGFSKANLASYQEKDEYSAFWGKCSSKNYSIFEDKNNDSILDEALAERLKKYDKITFVSHINKYSYSEKLNPKTNIINEYILDFYSCDNADASKPICKHLSYRGDDVDNQCAYNDGWQSLLDLKQYLTKDLNNAKEVGKPFTHIILYSMGWNTTQREAIQNFNYLHGNLIKLSKEDKELNDFNPLMIGITWPSDWALENGEGDLASRIIRPIKRMSSFFNKMNQADEVGNIWGSILVNKTLLPLKDDFKSLKIVLIGHSFGTRVITNSLFASKSDSNKVDLLLGLQGAFPINRFVLDKKTEPNSYKNFKSKVKNIVYTWSPYDSAVSIPNLVNEYYIGSNHGYENVAKKYPEIFETADIDSCGNIIKKGLIKKGDYEKECFLENLITHDPDKILYLNASKVINHNPENEAGGAHSDIYHDSVTKVIINSMKLIR